MNWAGEEAGEPELEGWETYAAVEEEQKWQVKGRIRVVRQCVWRFTLILEKLSWMVPEYISPIFTVLKSKCIICSMGRDWGVTVNSLVLVIYWEIPHSILHHHCRFFFLSRKDRMPQMQQNRKWRGSLAFKKNPAHPGLFIFYLNKWWNRKQERKQKHQRPGPYLVTVLIFFSILQSNPRGNRLSLFTLSTSPKVFINRITEQWIAVRHQWSGPRPQTALVIHSNRAEG